MIVPDVVGGHQPPADVKRCGAEHAPTFGDGQLGRAAADVDIEHSALVFSGMRDRARAVRGQQRFEVVAGRGADEVSSLRGEQVGDGARVVAPDRFAGEDDCAGVDVARGEAGFLIGGVDETTECLIVYPFAACAIGSQVDRRQDKAYPVR